MQKQMHKLPEIKQSSISKDKRGLGQVLSGFILVSAVLILMVLLLYVFGVLGDNFDAGSASLNATNTAIDSVSNAVPLVGILFVVLAIGAIIGVLISSFMGGRAKRA